MTELYSLLAATAAERLGLAPRVAPLDTTSVHVDGRYHSNAKAAEPVGPIPLGDRRDPRPDFSPVIWKLTVAPPAGMPRLMTPLSGTSRDTHDVGAAVRLHVQPGHTTSGPTDLVTPRALLSCGHP